MCHKCSPDLQRRDDFSPDGGRRYVAVRTWNEGPRLAVVMANPAPYDAKGENATTRAVMRIACSNGYGGVLICNLDPRMSVAILEDGPIQDPANERAIAKALESAQHMWAAWGITAARMPGAPGTITAMLARRAALSIGTTRDGQPLHPCRKASSSRLRPLS